MDSRVESLEEHLANFGFRRIPLQKNGAGHFQTTGELAGRPLTVLVDTGAGATIVDLALVRELDLEHGKLPATGGGAGGTSLEIRA